MGSVLDEEKAPRLFRGWQALVGVLADGRERPASEVYEEMEQVCDLAHRTVKNLVLDAQKEGYLVMRRTTRSDGLGRKTVTLSSRGQELLERIGTGVSELDNGRGDGV